VQSDDVQSTIEKAFLRNAELESGHIRVQAMAGQVVLEGNVKTWHERQIAEQAAWSAPGVTSVDDRIRVS
jgi:osmotically-inducible protein OsmY